MEAGGKGARAQGSGLMLSLCFAYTDILSPKRPKECPSSFKKLRLKVANPPRLRRETSYPPCFKTLGAPLLLASDPPTTRHLYIKNLCRRRFV